VAAKRGPPPSTLESKIGSLKIKQVSLQVHLAAVRYDRTFPPAEQSPIHFRDISQSHEDS
jgi:hypothetical protein